MKRKLSLFALPLCVLMSCNSGDKTATESTTTTASADSTATPKDNTNTNDGWTNLFDGTSTNGWHSYGKVKANERWKVADGVVYLDTTVKSEGGDLVSDKEYENFDLKLEWKISPKGNSGIIFYIHEDKQYKETYVTGPEMQVVDNEGHPDGKLIKHKAGDLYDLISSSKESAKPVGEWNEAEIKSKDGKLDLFLNGTNVVSTTLWDDNWKKLVAGSKFKTMKDFGSFKKGKIALQDHGNMVSYRNIKIKEN